MSTWYSRWTPGLPSINLPFPTSIQRRFISFVLKKSLGHLLKPGQLDIEQIDSQLGSGHVQINDLELDNEAINKTLAGLPVELRQGSISSVTARIPWPNPLTSVVGLSAKGLHLTFHLLAPGSAASTDPHHNLADSVADMAGSFVHDELTTTEEAALRESFYPAEQIVPGGMDPFIAAPEEEMAAEVQEIRDADPAGVSIFATLIERLLARFEFDAADTTITLVHPDHTSFSLCISETMYCTEQRAEEANQAAGPSKPSGETRMITVSGLSVKAIDIRPSLGIPFAQTSPVSYSPSTGLAPPSRSSSPASSSSSLDDESHAMMTQSLAFLPPRPASPASSVASSMYESAISYAPDLSGEDALSEDRNTLRHTSLADTLTKDTTDTILSFGPDPLVLRVTTPVPQSGLTTDVAEVIDVSLHIPVIAFGFAAWHINGALQVVDVLSRAFTKEEVERDPTPQASLNLRIQARARGLIAVLLPSVPGTRAALPTDFFERPLLPPKIPQPYIRLHLENLNVSADKDAFKAALEEMSGFVVHRSTEDESSLASPLFITDHHLQTQYDPGHTDNESDLPTFQISESTKMAGLKVSQWRTKLKSRARRNSDALFEVPPAISITGKRTTLAQRMSTSIEVAVEPLHLFVDLQLLADEMGVLAFLNEIAVPGGGVAIPVDDESDISTPPASPHARREKERQRLEQIVLDDLGLEADYRPKAPKPRLNSSPGSPRKQQKARNDDRNTTQISVHCCMIRVQVRSPPPPEKRVRSGALVLDVHGISLSTEPAVLKASARFASGTEPPTGEHVMTASVSRILLAIAAADDPKASGFLSIGPLPSLQSVETPLPCQLTFTKPNASSAVVAVRLPSIYLPLSKTQFDALQYFADDASQALQRISSDKESESKDSSLIGSRFFAKSRTASGITAGIDSGRSLKSATLIKIEVSEVLVQVMVPREPSGVYPLKASASDLDVLVQVKPEGKDKTVVTLSVSNLDILNSSAVGDLQSLLALTIPRGLASGSKPLLKLGFTSLVVPGTTVKETRVKIALWGFTCDVSPDVQWAKDLGLFIKPPPGAFETVAPTERTQVSLQITDGSVRIKAAEHPGILVAHAEALSFATVVGDQETPDSSFDLAVGGLALLMVDNGADVVRPAAHHSMHGVRFWRKSGFALLTELSDLDLVFKSSSASDIQVIISRVNLHLHLCADSLSAVGDYAKDLAAAFKTYEELAVKPKQTPAVVSSSVSKEALMASVEEMAFRSVPEVGPPPDMIQDDLPTNMDYLDESFGAAAGLRELNDDDLDDFAAHDNARGSPDPGIVSVVGGETVKMLRPEGLHIVEHHFDALPPDTSDGSANLGATTAKVRVSNANINVLLYDGYDWARTRRTIEDEVKQMRKRLAKIRQLVAGGQTQDPHLEETSALLFNSVYIGLEQDVDELEPGEIIAAIDEELRDDFETTSQSSWQSLRPAGAPAQSKSPALHGKRLKRSKTPSIEFQLKGMGAEVDQFKPDEAIVSRVFFTIKDLEILDHIKTSTWKKFLTELHSDSRGNIRETDSNMVRVELRSVKPVPGHPSEEARLRAKILPLRLYVDQDALDFLKKFFSFKDPQAAPPGEPDAGGDIYFQLAEIFPVDLKLDYKPRRVDYRALREGKTIELMNFFHFDGAEMTLRQITLAGISGWPRLFDLLNDIWTPDVKATQLVDVISGVAPIRSVVNVGSGVADLVLLPIAQYKKDGRIVRGVQKGTTAFFKSTAVEAIRLGAHLATGTQVILEQAEGLLGGQFQSPVTTETVPGLSYPRTGSDGEDSSDEREDLISKYAEQPTDLKEGMQSAYRSLQRNLNSAAQTILAVPMEVYERSGNEGPVRSVIRAVPIAVLKPMIGASEAVSKTLLGLHNTLDPNIRHENEAKYKHR
ncbi:unnamed protein product [Mycena citricolor]|uniref:Autophagy-related protein 2 n=1 Tax=Mycena citricolor TaxID=2018698 RepID=A0AAD2HMQ8_9AGAR|nr:unnamed protein product [Mycena citricolor]